MRVLWLSAVAVLVDQVTKVAVLNLMYRGQSIPLVGDWLKFTFTENPGMAFGIEVGPRGLVTVFSIVATALVLWYMTKVRDGYEPYLASLALIFGGALGNIIDRVFYGVILDYGTFFTGKVVDFIHVDIGYVQIPSFIPFAGGIGMQLFPIWNVADMAIVGGVIGILVFQKQFHDQFMEQAAERRAASAPVTDAPADGPAQAADTSPTVHASETARAGTATTNGKADRVDADGAFVVDDAPPRPPSEQRSSEQRSSE